MGHFNAEVSNNLLDDFCEPYKPKNFIKKTICFKN